MAKKAKLIECYLNEPTDFHYKEVVKLLGYFGFSEMKTGKTVGSRVKFIDENSTQIKFHKPHPMEL